MGPGISKRLLGATLEVGTNRKTSKPHSTPSRFASCLETFLVPNPMFLHLLSIFVCVYFWHCFGAAYLGVMSASCSASFYALLCRCCKTSTMQHFQEKCLPFEMLGLRFCVMFANLLICLLLSRSHFCCFVQISFYRHCLVLSLRVQIPVLQLRQVPW